MKILICSIMPQGAYSGGRYHAWMMAQAFAALGHQVTFWTNNTPIFIDDFEDFDFGDRFVLRLTRDFSDTPDGPWDFVWIIPHKHPPVKVFRRALDISVANKAKLGMLSFETPNWIAKTAEHGTPHGAQSQASSPRCVQAQSTTRISERAFGYIGSH